MCFLFTTGLILRRCTLDAIGLASWENPTYIKCVSKNYENIQMLVSPEKHDPVNYNPKCLICFWGAQRLRVTS